MSFLSRLFGKTPAPAPLPSPPEKAASRPSAADRALADHAQQKALQAAIDAGDAQGVARLVVEGSSTRVRQAAAAAVQDPELLRQLIRDVRGGNDKSVYKILAAKRDALNEQARKQEQLQAEIAAVAEVLERLSRRPYDTLSNGKLEQAERRWKAVEEQMEPELRARGGQWLALARETVEAPLREAAGKAAGEQAAAEAAAQARRQREQQAQAAAEAAAEQMRVHEEQERAVAEERQAEQQAIRQIGEMIRKARAALGDGNTARAASLRRTIEEKLAGAPPLPANLAGPMQQLDKQLEELKDWKSFSVTPKRGELIAEMESLIGETFDPVVLADRIRSLQDEWRTMNKGAGENAEAEWQRFHEAAQKAYQPCSEYFAAQAAVRKENLQKREALLARLTAFEAGLNWEQPDWRSIINTLRATKQEWRSHSAVERKAGKPQQEAFEALTAGMQARLDAEYARNVKQKEALIERAKALLADEDGRRAVDTIKQLQQQWQAVGPIPREADQRLWGEFRQHCDAVFQKRQQESAAHAAGMQNNRIQALALCAQIEEIAALEGAELLAQAASLPGLRKAFEAIGELPRAESRELHKRLEQALERCRKAVVRQNAREAERSWDELLEAANLVRAHGLAVARGLDAEQAGALKEAAEARIASVQRWPKGGLDALKRGLAAGPSADLAANEAALRTLCIRAEILTDTATPQEDQALRRDYQLQRLVQGMGQGSRSGDASLDAMALEWVSSGPVDDAAYEPLLSRFQACRARGAKAG